MIVYIRLFRLENTLNETYTMQIRDSYNSKIFLHN